MTYGLIGERLSHSYSLIVHRLLGNSEYELKELPPDKVDAFMQSADYKAINVTIPYKQTVIPYCTLDEAAKKIGSVNTIVNRGGQLFGYNTDYAGFSYMAKRAGVCFEGRKVLVLGSGGTSKTVRCVAQDAGAREIIVLSRSGEHTYESINRHYDSDILINTTPVGMFPKNGELPVSLHSFIKLQAVLDVIYNPLNTFLVLEAKSRGINASGGLSMLVAQAVYAHNLFFDRGNTADDEKIETVLQKVESGARSIILVGMPGCGKSTIGKALASRLNLEFCDTDSEIEARTAKTPGEIITEDGEQAFRELESEVVLSLCSLGHRVIATGGGAVLSPINRMAMRQNGVVIFLERPIDELATENRPLSNNRERLEAMYEKRLPLYREVSQYTMSVSRNKNESLEKLMEVLAPNADRT